jgi:hypothetical protein
MLLLHAAAARSSSSSAVSSASQAGSKVSCPHRHIGQSTAAALSIRVHTTPLRLYGMMVSTCDARWPTCQILDCGLRICCLNSSPLTTGPGHGLVAHAGRWSPGDVAAAQAASALSCHCSPEPIGGGHAGRGGACGSASEHPFFHSLLPNCLSVPLFVLSRAVPLERSHPSSVPVL